MVRGGCGETPSAKTAMGVGISKTGDRPPLGKFQTPRVFWVFREDAVTSVSQKLQVFVLVTAQALDPRSSAQSFSSEGWIGMRLGGPVGL